MKKQHLTRSRGNMTIIVGIIILLIIFAGAALFTKEAEAPEGDLNDTATTTDSMATTTDDTSVMHDDGNTTTDEGITIVTYTKDGFSPKGVTISVGDTVRFENESGPSMWVATAQHPTHTVYPDTDIKKCDTAEEEGIFDACRNYEAGDNWDYTFTEVGEWFYHNHSRANHFGKVIVTSN